MSGAAPSDNDDFDLEAYLARIGYEGPRAPTRETLAALHALQPAAIAFENLDPLLGRPVALEPAALQDKLVGHARGGYCFELNALFALALRALGFAVTPLAARVRWGRPAPPESPRTHMLLRVDLDDGALLADVGFGGHLLDAPLQLAAGVEQATPASRFRLLAEGEQLMLQAWIGEAWGDAYVFTLEPQHPVDYALANWYTATHPESLFRNNLLMERLTPGRRLSLFNTKLTERTAGTAVRETMLGSADELGEVLARQFGLDAPAASQAIWSRLPKG